MKGAGWLRRARRNRSSRSRSRIPAGICATSSPSDAPTPTARRAIRGSLLSLSSLSVRAALAATLVLGTATAHGQQFRFDDVIRNLRNPDPKTRLASVQLLRESKYPEAIGPLAP